MNIHENTALLDAFLDGELTAEEAAQVQSHLAQCPDCQAYVDDALAIRAEFPTEDTAELPENFAENVMAAVAKAPQSRPKKQPWGKLLAAAACLAVILLVQHNGGMDATGSSQNTSGSMAYSTMDTAANESAPASGDSYQEFVADDSGDSADTFTAQDGAKTATTTDAADGAAPQEAPQENGTATTTSEAFKEHDLPTVRITAADLGDLLDDRTPTEITDSGAKRYLLTRAEFDDLAQQLAEQGVTLETEDSTSDSLWLEVSEN